MRRVILVSLVIGASSWTLLLGAAPATLSEVGDAVVLEDRFGRQAEVTEGQTVIVQFMGLADLKQLHVSKGYRATVCDSFSARAVCRRLVGANTDDATLFPAPLTAATTIVKVERALFGFADLHVHPAAHLAWGARGGQGLLWGNPGMAHTNTSISSHLRVCNEFHSTPATAGQVVTRPLFLLIKEPHHAHTGYPAFADWPSAESVLHQQMHVSMLRRAWQGGLRLMVASATDNQMLDIIWNPDFSISQGRFALREDADHKAAAEQFDFIRQFVTANASWMAIVTTPAEARAAISLNKLAVVLGLRWTNCRPKRFST